MRTTVNLDTEAYELAKAVESKRHTTLGTVLSEAVFIQFRTHPIPSTEVTIDAESFPVLYLGHPITPAVVAEGMDP